MGLTALMHYWFHSLLGSQADFRHFRPTLPINASLEINPILLDIPQCLSVCLPVPRATLNPHRGFLTMHSDATRWGESRCPLSTLPRSKQERPAPAPGNTRCRPQGTRLCWDSEDQATCSVGSSRAMALTQKHMTTRMTTHSCSRGLTRQLAALHPAADWQH